MNSSLSYNAEAMYPNDWKLQRLNVVASLYGRIGWQGLTTDEYLDEGPWLVTGTDFVDGGINWDACVRISDRRWREARQIQLQPGDLIITKDGTVGKLAIVSNQPGKASLNSGLMRIVPRREDAYSTKYLYYVLNTDIFTEWFRNINAGVSTIQHLFQKDFNHFIFPLPPLSEQKSIVSFLDRICGQSNRLLDCINRQIELLESYRSSIIHEVVTKGLDSHCAMKRSGVDWIGNIPQHWKLMRIKDVVRLQTGQTPPTDDQSYFHEEIDWLTPADIGPDSVLESSRYISRRAIKDGRAPFIPAGSVLLVCIGATAGKSSYLLVNGSCNQQVTALIPFSINGEYLSRVISAMSSALRDKALYTTLPILNNQFIGQQLIPMPPESEQKDISGVLKQRCAAIDAVIDTKRRQLDVLKRRRQSLIYEYVTGKRRVGTKG